LSVFSWLSWVLPLVDSFGIASKKKINPLAQLSINLFGYPNPLAKSRGEKNNNLGNIKRSNSNNWRGRSNSKTGKESTFEQFFSYEYGLRAMIITLLNYQKLHNIKNIRGIIERYAPKSENDTEQYIEFVEAQTGIPDTKNFSFTPESLEPIVKAMVKMESNFNVSKKLYNNAVSLI